MSVDKLSLVIQSGTYERVHYGLALAAGAAASNIPCTLFFTMTASHALLATPGWHSLLPSPPYETALDQDIALRARAVAGFDELLECCAALNVTFMICEMGLRATDLDTHPLRSDLTIRSGGIVTFLSDASQNGAMMMV